MADVKQQHYLPQFYLKSFADAEGFLHVVRRCGGQLGSPYKGKTGRVCSKKYLHEVYRRSSTHGEAFYEKGIIEAELGSVENALAPSYRDLLCCLENGSLPDDYPDAIRKLMALIAFFIARSPKWLQLKRNEAGEVAARLLEKGLLDENDIGWMSDEDSRGELEALVELGIMDAALFSTAEGAPVWTLVDLMFDKDCCFFKSPGETAFITASFPAYVARASEGDTNPVAIYFPLSPRFAAVFREGTGEGLVCIEDASAELVTSLNRLLMNGNDAWEMLIASDRDVLDGLLKEYRISN